VEGGVARLARLVRDARSVVALTGAGISVPSGIPDFRSPGTGIWEHVDPMAVAHVRAWRADPARFWSFYGARFQTLADKQPNGAHAALVELERRGLLHAVITQNIDMLHRRAGTRELVEVHGSIATSSCLDCGASYDLERVVERLGGDFPACDCGRPLKPDVVLFGELLPPEGDRPRRRARRGRRPAAVHRLVAGGASRRGPAAADARRRRSDRDRHAGRHPVGRRRGGAARRRRRGRAARARGGAVGRLPASCHMYVWFRHAFRGRPRTRGLRIHRTRSLDPRDVTRHRAITITTPARTLRCAAAGGP
jgi:NAD-dependent SIR2 family protein deacetylase